MIPTERIYYTSILFSVFRTSPSLPLCVFALSGFLLFSYLTLEVNIAEIIHGSCFEFIFICEYDFVLWVFSILSFYQFFWFHPQFFDKVFLFIINFMQFIAISNSMIMILHSIDCKFQWECDKWSQLRIMTHQSYYRTILISNGQHLFACSCLSKTMQLLQMKLNKLNIFWCVIIKSVVNWK